MLIFYLYINLTKTSLDIFNCNSTTPPDGHTYELPAFFMHGRLMTLNRHFSAGTSHIRLWRCRYLEVVFVQCNKPGGMQLRLLPFAIATFMAYTVGFPLVLAIVLIRNRKLIVEDQVQMGWQNIPPRLCAFDADGLFMPLLHRCCCVAVQPSDSPSVWSGRAAA